MSVRKYLESLRELEKLNIPEDWAYCGVADAILRDGISADEVEELPSHIRPGQLGYCYENATMCAIDNAQFRYVEGYASMQGIPLPHAWVYDISTDTHYDPTWIGIGSDYHGVAFSTKFLLSFSIETGYYGIWGSDDLKSLNEMMRTGFPPGAILQPVANNGRRRLLHLN
jgi:hypothetical protein